MKIIFTDGIYEVSAEKYTAKITADHIRVLLAGEQVCALCPMTAVNKPDCNDVPKGEGTFEFCEENSTFVWSEKTPAWNKSEFILTLFEDRLEYCVKVHGDGKVKSVEYFIGDKDCGFHGSEYEFDTGFMPIPTVDGALQCTFNAQKPYDEFSYLTIPPIFCYTFDICGIDEKLSMGLVAKKGEHNFTKFTYDTYNGAYLRRFWLATNQDGHTTVDGEWETPKILIYPSASIEDSLKKYCDYYFDNGIANRKKNVSYPKFHYGPIACGWIEQAAYAMLHRVPKSCFDMANEDLYNHFISEMKRRDLHPRILIIDDKWQSQYGTAFVNTEKWSDLRGWIDNNLKENNCHTMLWYKLWDSEGLPEEMTMLDEASGRRVADPTNPKYKELLKEIMHRLLSSDEGCYNAYGLKLDYAFFQPVGEKSDSYNGKYGVELFLEYIKTIYEIAKEVKPECVISASPCHPLFNEYLDHARLHDYFPDLRRAYEEFSFRKMIYSLAIPDALIDTDGASFNSRRDTMRYMKNQYKLGIPDLYCITPMPSLELTDGEWAEIAAVWKEYEKGIDAKFAE